MARLEKALVNGEEIEVGAGLEGRIASAIERRGGGSCVILQVGVDGRSYSFAFPHGCGGKGGGGGGAGSTPPELTRLHKVYESALEEMRRNAALIRKAVMEFIRSL